MKKKLPIILTALAAVIAIGVYVVCSGRNDTTVQNPSAESTPTESMAPVAPPIPEIENAAKQEVTPEPVPDVTVTPEPDPVVAPEPPVESTPVEPEKIEPSPEPEKKPEKEPVADAPAETLTENTQQPNVTNPYDVPVPDTNTAKPTGPDESNKREEQARQEAQQSSSSKFKYPANSTTEGLSSFYINAGAYIDKSTGMIYDQEGNCYGKAPGYENTNVEDTDKAVENTDKNAQNIYNGDGSGSDTSGWGN